MKHYTKISRFNPRLSFDQYQVLLKRKREALEEERRIRYRDLINEWGIRQSVLATAIRRGIKQYDYILWKRGEL